jgi:hypothetical protein
MSRPHVVPIGEAEAHQDLRGSTIIRRRAEKY